MSTIQRPQALLEAMQALHKDVIVHSEEAIAAWYPLIKRESFRESAVNLASYLAFRSHELRDLQQELMRWGLSSLGRSEARLQPSLNAVIATLGAITGADPTTLPAYPDEASFFQGARNIEREANLLFGKPRGNRTTRIMVTLPSEAAHDMQLMKSLVNSGVECVRINCAHDDAATWKAMIHNLRLAENELGSSRQLKVLMDLGGPKVRTVRPKKNEKDLYFVGDQFLLVSVLEQNDDEGVEKEKPAKHKGKKHKSKLPIVGCTLYEALEQLMVGERVFIDDGQIGARVLALVAEGAICEIFQAPAKGSKIRSHKGLNFPDTKFTVVPLTDKDRNDLDFVAQNADIVGYSFVQSESDVILLLRELGKRVPKNHPSPALIIKIETRQAVRNLPGMIVQAAGKLPTAVMIARGDLAIELGFQRMAEMQEEILWLCEAAHVPVIWATQVLEGLAKEGVPTRAEVTDAAMANRAECVMLNKGSHILDAIHMLDNVLTRMAGHQHKKTPQLRALQSWQVVFEVEADEDANSDENTNSDDDNGNDTEGDTDGDTAGAKMAEGATAVLGTPEQIVS